MRLQRRGRQGPDAASRILRGARILTPLRCRAAAALVALCLSVGAFAGPKEDLQALRQKVDALTRELAASETSKADATDALRESEQAISRSGRHLFDLRAREAEARARLAELDTEQERLGGDVRTQQETLSNVLRHAYMHGQVPAAALLLSPGEPGAAARRLHYLGYLARDRAAAIEQLRRDQARVQALAEESRQQTLALEALQAEQSAAQRELERQRGERAAALARVSAQIDRQRREMDQLKRGEERLTRLVQKLAKQIAKRTPAKKRPAAPGGKNASRAKNAKSASDEKKVTPASKQTGPAAAAVRLPDLEAPVGAPVKGELTARFGSPRSGTGLRWNGWFISASPGTPVKAPTAGRVVFADWLRGFGNLLILDHGEGLMSLYGNNETLLRAVGDEVRAGEQIASVGNSGGSADSGLYFELRYQGKPVDPARWIASR